MMKFILLLSLLLSYTLAQQIIAGAELMNRGLDFWKGGLVPNNLTKSPIFKLTIDPNRKWSPPTRTDLVFLIPKEFSLVPNATHYELTQSDLYYSYEQTIKVDIKAWSFGININLGYFGLGFAYSKESGKIREYLKEKFKASAKTYYHTSVYALNSLPPFLLQLDDIFKMTLDYLPNTPKPEDLPKYKIFMDYYGGWFAYRGNFGGVVKLFTFVDKEISESRNLTWTKEQMKLTFHLYMYGLSAGGWRSKEEIEKRISKQFREHTLTEMFYHGGFRQYQKNDTLKEWDRSIDDEAGLLEASFKPLSDLVQNNDIKKKNLEWMIKTYSETGKLAVPPSSLLVQGLPKIPGYLVIGSGFDVSTMMSKISIFEHEEGFANPTVWTNPFYPQHQFIVPSTVRITDNTGNLEKNLTQVALSKNEYEAQFSRRWTKSFAFGFGKRSTSVYHYYYRFEMMQEYKLEMERMLTWYDLNIKPSLLFEPEKYMSSNFKTVIDYLGTDCNNPEVRKLYRSVIEYYGSHLVTGASMGGSAQLNAYFKKDLLKTFQINEVITRSGFSFLGFLKFHKYNYKMDRSLEGWFKDNTTIEVKWIGGRYNPEIPGKEPWQAFIETLRTDPGVMHYTLLPLSTLFKDTQKKSCMESVTNEYLAKASISKYIY